MKDYFQFKHWPIWGLGFFFASVGMYMAFIVSISVSKTAGHQFCSQCHAMIPFTKSYLQDPHGGNNSRGIRATCSDCHLPHDGTFNYLFTKAGVGVRHTFISLTHDVSKIDWNKMREKREHYTYDSGCLNCHKNLELTSKANRKAFRPHKYYFENGEPTCVNCHKHVGHHHLNDHVTKFFNKSVKENM